MTRAQSIVVIGVVAASALARAQPSGAQAETLFREGRALIAQGKVAEACAAFEQSQKLEPTTTTLVSLAGCREKNGQIASAWGLFLEAERQLRTSTDDVMRQLHGVALDHAQKLEARVSKLTISVPAESRIDRLEILRGTDLVDAPLWNHALPVDGGTYKIMARASGAVAWTTSVTLAPDSDTKTVEIPKLQTITQSDRSAGPTKNEEPTRRRSRVIPIALGAGAVVALAVGFAFERSGEATYDQAKRDPDPTKQDDLWHSANTKRYVAEGLGVAGLVGASVGVWLYLSGGGDESSVTASARTGKIHVVPAISSDRAGLVVVGRY